MANIIILLNIIKLGNLNIYLSNYRGDELVYIDPRVARRGAGANV